MYASASRRLPRKVRPCFVSTSRSIPTKCRSKGARIDSPDDDDDDLALFVVEEAVEVVDGFRVDSVAAAGADAIVLHFDFGLCVRSTFPAKRLSSRNDGDGCGDVGE